MKKIYMILAAMTLLSMSLNAQLKSYRGVVPTTSTEKVEVKEATPPDGHFRVGPSRASTDPVTPPYSNGFDNSTETNWWEVLNNNNDGSYWTFSSGEAVYNYSSSNAADDWLVTAPVQLEAGRVYKFYINARNRGSYTERLEVKLASANTATALSNGTTVIAATNVTNNTHGTPLSNENVTVSTTGLYYFGIHAISAANMWTLYVDNLVIGVESTDPTIQVSENSVNLSSIPGGTATQTVTVTGLNLTEGITASISGGSEFSVSPASLGTTGGDLTISYSPSAIGTNSATLTLSSPGADPVNITLNGTCAQDLTICDGTGTNTNLPIYGYYYDNYQKNQMIYPESMVGSLTGRVITSMTFYAASNFNFSGGQLTVRLGTTDQTNYTGKVRLQPADMTIVKSGFDVPSGGNTWTIEFDTPFEYNGGNLVVDFEETSHGSGSGSYSNGFSFYGTTHTGGGFFSYGDTYSADFGSVYSGGSVQNFLPKVTIASESNEPRHDLSIALSAPATVIAGNTVTVTATIYNNGNQTETGYTVTITDGTNTVNQTASEPLNPKGSQTFTANFPTDANASSVSFTATVVCADDADATNNSATATTSLIVMPPPENVAANATGNTGTMTWDAPSTFPNLPVTVTENFDDTSIFPAYSVGGISATQHTGAFGDWTLYDPSGANVFGDEDLTWENESAPHAWQVFPASTFSMSAHSGDQFMLSIDCVTSGGNTNHWLISPELSGDAQTIDFYLAEITTSYGPETYEIWVSTTDNNPDSFTKLGDGYSINSTAWTPQSVNLPAGTKYFAIRHTSYDIYGMMVDDITYETIAPTPPESYNVYLDGEFVGNVDANTFSYTFSNVADGEHECAVSAVYPGGYESAAIPATFTILPTPNAPAVSSNDGTTSTTITITPDANTDGQLVYYVDYNGSQTQDLTFPRDAQDYTVTVHAYTEATANYNQSPEAVVTVTIPALPQTAAPTIAISSQTDNQVTITATGNGTVTLTINGQTVEGNGSASITVPRQMQDYVVSASATAQVSGELVSETTTQNVTIPGMASSGEWTEMVGTYNNPNDLLSFQVKVGNDTTDIMLIDQFMASTVHNDHPNGYTYVLKETINGEEKSSNPANVPVYKTNSNLNGFYTEAQVIADNKYDENKLTAHTLNTQIEYDVVPDNNVLYYSLYRGDKNEQRPVIDVDHRISQLQKFEDKVDGNVMYYFNENHLQGVLPRYEHIGSQTAQRLDMNYVTGTGDDELSYVPVIWTFGLYTARGDGKNNSYGSDIKHSYVGKVNISVEGLKNDGNNTTGQWDADGTTYCVYSPIITLGGITPDDGGANDGDTYQYVPYMYRVWCTYPNAHNFTHLDNPDGRKHLVDAGPIEAPFLIGEATAEDSVWHNNGEEVIIGRALESGEAQQPWSFGVPVNESSSNVQFVARFYYKKIVTPGAQVNGLRGTRDNDEAAFAIAENSDDGQGIVTGINELADIVYVVSTTYVNAQGMQSDKPFDGLNIVVTRYSDGTTRTTKVVR